MSADGLGGEHLERANVRAGGRVQREQVGTPVEHEQRSNGREPREAAEEAHRRRARGLGCAVGTQGAGAIVARDRDEERAGGEHEDDQRSTGVLAAPLRHLRHLLGRAPYWAISAVGEIPAILN